jgi:hypothetical protein
MTKSKKSTSLNEKQVNRPPKPRYTSIANQYYSEVVAPIERAYDQAMRLKNYKEAGNAYEQLTQAKKHHRLLIARKELVLIKK